MGNKKCWLTFVKKLLTPHPKPDSKERNQKSRKWRWVFRVFKFRQCPAIEAPEKSLNEAVQEQRKRALAAAVATAAAAEAAVAAAKAAAEVVRLTDNVPREYRRRNAAVRIQSSYRGHLARKALNALKGLVKLQAVVRGELIRRRFNKRVRQKRVLTMFDCVDQCEKRNSLSHREELRCKTQRAWDLSSISKEDLEALCLQKREAMTRRERMKQYSCSHRERRGEHHAEKEKMKQFSSHSDSIAIDASGVGQLKLRTTCASAPRRSMGNDRSGKGTSRSLSTPKQRVRLCETQDSPYKLSLISWSSSS